MRSYEFVRIRQLIKYAQIAMRLHWVAYSLYIYIYIYIYIYVYSSANVFTYPLQNMQNVNQLNKIRGIMTFANYF